MMETYRHESCRRCVHDSAKGPLCPECYDSLREEWRGAAEAIKELFEGEMR